MLKGSVRDPPVLPSAHTGLLLLCSREPTASAERQRLLHLQVRLPKRSLWLQIGVQLWLPVGEALLGPLGVTLGGQQRLWLLWPEGWMSSPCDREGFSRALW